MLWLWQLANWRDTVQLCKYEYEHHGENDCLYCWVMISFALKTDKTLRWNLGISVSMQPHIHHVTLTSNRVYYSPFLTVFLSHSALWTYAAEVVSLNNRLIICFVRDSTAGCDNGIRRVSGDEPERTHSVSAPWKQMTTRPHFSSVSVHHPPLLWQRLLAQ